MTAAERRSSTAVEREIALRSATTRAQWRGGGWRTGDALAARYERSCSVAASSSMRYGGCVRLWYRQRAGQWALTRRSPVPTCVKTVQDTTTLETRPERTGPSWRRTDASKVTDCSDRACTASQLLTACAPFAPSSQPASQPAAAVAALRQRVLECANSAQVDMSSIVCLSQTRSCAYCAALLSCASCRSRASPACRATQRCSEAGRSVE